jgi:predicted O-methyltransferase YrrM
MASFAFNPPQCRRVRREARDGSDRMTADDLLDSMYAGEPQLGIDGRHHAIDESTRISREQGAVLAGIHRLVGPDLSIEIGLAYGFSTVFFLAAIRDGGGGRHLAIDPYQRGLWHGIGLTRATLLGMEDRFECLEKPSRLALPELAAAGRRAQLVYIDGDHKFDSALLDFLLADAICDIDGCVIFDDMWLPSIRKAVRFIEANRPDYALLDSPLPNIALFRKTSDDRRDWRHYVEF